VPIHPFLLQLGFREFVESRRQVSEDGRIFPLFRYSRFFNDTLLWEALSIKKPEICFHSLRHNFKDALRNATEDLEARDRLCGHAVPGMSGVYGEKFVSAAQAAAIDKVQFPVDLSHLLP
jgi:integrase